MQQLVLSLYHELEHLFFLVNSLILKIIAIYSFIPLIKIEVMNVETRAHGVGELNRIANRAV